jgi:hypothetical protein
MGVAYHYKNNRTGDNEATKEYSELRDLIKQTVFYQDVVARYKDVYRYDDGNIDYASIAEEALGQALAVVLYDKFNGNTKATFAK